jgi:hypothetical protein
MKRRYARCAAWFVMLTIGVTAPSICQGRRAVAVEHLHYNPDGTIRPIQQTA